MYGRRKEKMYPHLPEDLVRQILQRLPVKSLLRFRVVCKSWSRMISSKAFVNDHVAISKDNDDLCLLRYREDNLQKYLLCPDHRFRATWQSAERLVLPFSETGFLYLDAGYCNGIICLLFCRPEAYGFRSRDCYAILWNPSIRKHLIAKIPNLPPWNWSVAKGYNFGFGFDSVSGNYKLVNMLEFSGKIYPVEWSLIDGKYRKTSHEKASSVFEKLELPFRRSVFLNGKCHWLVTNSNKDISGLISYDLHNQALNRILVPNGLIKCHDSSLHIFGDRLSLCIDTRSRTRDCISLWIMKEYGVAGSWTKVFESRNLTSVDKLIGLRSRGEVVYCRRNGELVSYGQVNQKIHNSKVKVVPDPPFYFNGEVSFYLDRYKETLALFDEADTADYEDPVAEEFR